MEKRFFALFVLLAVLVIFAATFVSHPRARPSLSKGFIVIRHVQQKGNEGVESDHLTKKEKFEGYKLGRKLSVRYRKFLGYYYQPEEFSAHSIPNENAMAVARFLSTSLFPPSGIDWWKKEGRWDEIPIYPESFFNRTICPRFYDDIVASRKDLNLLGMKNDSNSGADFVQEIEAKSEYFDDMTAMFLKFFRFHSSFFGFQRHLIGGPYVQKMINFFTKSAKKMELHLWNNMNILILLNILKIEVKTDESTFALAIELHKNNGEDYFEVYYISNTQPFKSTPIKMQCGSSCPLVDLISLSKDYNREEYKELCVSRTD